MTMLKKSVVSAAIFPFLLGVASPVWADEMPSQQQLWHMLQQQQKEIQMLKDRLAGTGHHETSPTANSGDVELKWTDRINISGVVEVAASYENDVENVESSDVSLATVELSIDAHVNDWVVANVVLLYEEGDTPLDVDGATITLGNDKHSPGYLTVGRMAVPFGNFSSNMLSDPVTLEMAETVESTVQLGYNRDGWSGSIYLFNGASDEVDGESHIDQFGANLSYARESDTLSYDLGISYINSMEDSDGITETLTGLEEDGGKEMDMGDMNSHVAGFGAYAVIGLGAFSLTGEYITALDRFVETELAWDNQGAKPSSWNAELGYGFELMGKEAQLAVALQGTSESFELGAPERRYLGGLSVTILENTALSFELRRDENYDDMDDSTDENSDAATLQLAVEF